MVESGIAATRRFLILGAMPKDADPSTHLAAGPWCFADQEELFPNWEEKFTFAPEPLADSRRLPGAAKAAQTLCTLVIPEIARSLAPDRNLPPVYWQTFLAPWAMDVARQIVERALRCQAMREIWGKQNLIVPVLARDMVFNFETEHDFSLNGSLNVNYNHWLFSLLLEADWPKTWQMETASVDAASGCGAIKTDAGKPKGFRIREIARNFALNLPFPRLKGMSVKQALLFSLALLHPAHGPDHSLEPQKDFNDPAALAAIPLPSEILPIFLRSMPRSIKIRRHPSIKPSRHAPRSRVASVIAYEDTSYRQKLSRWRARGNRLAYVQHGGNYGQVRVACDTAYVEYSQDAFFTWGWRNHGEEKGRFIPMPYPQLANVANRWHGGGKMIFVGTEMAAYGYRLDSRPTPLQFVTYRRDKAAFFAVLPAQAREKFLYRPYFPLPGTLADAAWLLARFPELKICAGALMPQILACDLLVLDHHGTTMLEAFSAGVPTILYWNRASWPLTPTCEALLARLADCGIWHDSPEGAARKTLEIMENPAKWRQDPAVAECIREYCQTQAMPARGNLDAAWINTLKKL